PLLLVPARTVRVDVALERVVGDADRRLRIAEQRDQLAGRAAGKRRLVGWRADAIPVAGERAPRHVGAAAQTFVGVVADGATLAAHAAKNVLAVRPQGRVLESPAASLAVHLDGAARLGR